MRQWFSLESALRLAATGAVALALVACAASANDTTPSGSDAGAADTSPGALGNGGNGAPDAGPAATSDAGAQTSPGDAETGGADAGVSENDAGATGGEDGMDAGSTQEDSTTSGDTGSGADTVADAGSGPADGGTGADAGGIPTVPPGEGYTDEHPTSCTLGKKWTGGYEGSPTMKPGGDCIGCHTNFGEGPKFTIAGTVFGHLHEADDCYGLSNGTVEITDSAGHVYELQTNKVGNFFAFKSKLPGWTPPYTARVIYNGVAREMFSPQTDGSCNSCHTVDGANGAPGRILVP